MPGSSLAMIENALNPRIVHWGGADVLDRATLEGEEEMVRGDRLIETHRVGAAALERRVFLHLLEMLLVRHPGRHLVFTTGHSPRPAGPSRPAVRLFAEGARCVHAGA